MLNKWYLPLCVLILMWCVFAACVVSGQTLDGVQLQTIQTPATLPQQERDALGNPIGPSPVPYYRPGIYTTGGMFPSYVFVANQGSHLEFTAIHRGRLYVGTNHAPRQLGGPWPPQPVPTTAGPWLLGSSDGLTVTLGT